MEVTENNLKSFNHMALKCGIGFVPFKVKEDSDVSSSTEDGHIEPVMARYARLRISKCF